MKKASGCRNRCALWVCVFCVCVLPVANLLVSCEKNSGAVPWTGEGGIFSFLPGKVQGKTRNKPVAEADRAPALRQDQNDEELLRIARDARDSLPEFFRRLQRPQNGEANFRVKYPFRADQGSGFSMEQLWLSNIHFRDGVFYGALANDTFYITAIKKGDTVSFSADDITDWMYTHNGVIIGGLSIKYLLEQIPDHDRTEKQRALLEMFKQEGGPVSGH